MILEAIILGIVEGISEFLPISSTGHLILAQRLLGMQSGDFWKSFDIFIQLGAILAVLVIYFKQIIEKRWLWKKILFAFLPTALLGLTVYKIIKNFLLGNYTVVLVSLFFGGIAIVCFEKWYSKKYQNTRLKKLEEISDKDAVKIGLFQAIAMIPGVSRSAATIIGGMWIGIERQAIVDFTFLLAIPTMAAATGLDLIQSGLRFSSQELSALAVGFITAFFVAWISVKFLLSYIKKNDFTAFGWYRIIFSLIFFWWILL